MMFGMQLTDYTKYDQIVQKIYAFREAKNNHQGSYKQFRGQYLDGELRDIYAEEISEGRTRTRESEDASTLKFLKTKARNMRDYTDACFRYLRATGLVSISQKGRSLSILPEKMEEVEFFLQNEDRKPVFIDDEASYKAYNRLPDDKQKLVVDPVASEVVKRIFNMASVGKNLREIAKALEEDKVLIPSAYTAEYHPEQNNNRRFKDPYRWRHGTIHDILNRKEYLGHTVLKKSERPNFKLKNRVAVDADEQFVFENTHEAIVDENTWNLAHKFQEKARRKK